MTKWSNIYILYKIIGASGFANTKSSDLLSVHLNIFLKSDKCVVGTGKLKWKGMQTNNKQAKQKCIHFISYSYCKINEFHFG